MRPRTQSLLLRLEGGQQRLILECTDLLRESLMYLSPSFKTENSNGVNRECHDSQTEGLISGEVPLLLGRSGELPDNLWIALKIHSERSSWVCHRGSSGEVQEVSGKSRELSGDPARSDSLPATRKNCLQL